MSTFLGLETAKSALSAFKKAIDITSTNISNVKTQGYSRQKPVISSAALSEASGIIRIGTGIDIFQVNRVVDYFVEEKIRNNLSYFNYGEVTAKYFSSLEGIFNEPSNTGLAASINDFFASWQELSTDGSSSILRSAVRGKAVSLANKFNYLGSQISQTRQGIDQEVQFDLLSVNNLITQIYNLNLNIKQMSVLQGESNSLMDTRDQLIKELSGFADVEAAKETDGSISIYLGGQALIQEKGYITLIGVANAANSNFVDIKFSNNLAGPNAGITNGKIKGLIDLRDDSVKGVFCFQNSLDNLASKFITAVNDQHAKGFGLDEKTGRNLFVPAGKISPALNMAVDPEVLNETTGLNVLAVSSTKEGLPGNADNARLMAGLQTSLIIDSAYTVNDYYNKLISDLGSFASESSRIKDNYQAVLDNLENLRDSISGVSLDEEAALLMEYQNAYQAAAKVISVYDELYDTILNMVK